MEKKPIEKLSSPDQLDRLLVVIRLPGWIALLVLLLISLSILLWSIFGSIPVTTSGRGILFNPYSIVHMQSDTEGVVKNIYVQERVQIKKGAPLLDLQTSEKEIKFLAPSDGEVLVLQVLPGEVVSFGQTLLWFQKPSEKNLIYSFFSLEKGDQIKPGMPAHIAFDSTRTELYGKMEGVVKEVLPLVVNQQSDVVKSIPSESLRKYLATQSLSVIVSIEPTLDPSTPSGYRWTTKEGPPYKIPFGSIADVKVTLAEKRPITYVIPLGGG